jgi:hypothetical protein
MATRKPARRASVSSAARADGMAHVIANARQSTRTMVDTMDIARHGSKVWANEEPWRPS